MNNHSRISLTAVHRFAFSNFKMASNLFNYKNKKNLVFTNNGVSSSSDESDDESESSQESSQNVDSDDNDDDDDAVEISPPANKRLKLLPDFEESPIDSPAVQSIAKPNMAKELISRLKQKTIESPVSNNSSVIIDDDVDTTVKVRMHGTIRKFTLNQASHFSDLQKIIASEEKKEPSQIALFIKEVPVKLNDTLANINVTTILECILYDSVPVTDDVEDDENTILLKIQTADSAQSIRAARCEYKVDKNEQLKSIFEKYAEANNAKLSDITFLFDGEEINEEKTPEIYSMEDEDIIDCVFKKS